MAEIPALEALRLGLFPVTGATEVAGPMYLNVGGTVNIIGGGSGGTSSIDNNPFTPAGTSITVVGGYHGGRTVASGNSAALALDGSGMLLVDVGAGGAGGGIANLTVRGSANQDIHVGYAGGASINSDGGAYMPILGTVNLGAGAAPFATVGVYGSPGFPIYNVGSVNVVNTVTMQAAGGSLNVVGSVGVSPLASFTVNLGGVATVWLANQNAGSGFATAAVYGSPNYPIYNIGSVNVVNTVAVTGGGFATMAVYGSPAFPLYAQFPSGYYPTVNIGAGGGGGSGFATVGVYGSIAAGSLNVLAGQAGAPWSVVGSMGITPLASQTVNFGGVATVWLANQNAGSGFATAAVYGSPNFPVYAVGSVNVQGSLGVGQIGSPWGVAGSLYATVNIAGGFATVWYGGLGADTTNSAIRVNVVAGGAGGGVANLTVTGTANTQLHVGFASQNTGVAWPNYDGAAWAPVMFPSGFYPTLNVGNPHGIFGTVGVYGSVNSGITVQGTANTPLTVGYASGANFNQAGGAYMPILGTVNIIGGGSGFATAAVYGSPNFPVYAVGSVNVQGSLGVGQIGSPWGVAGSLYATVNVLGSVSVLGSVNLGGVGVVDVRGSLVPTGWAISGAASGQFVVVGTAPASQRAWLNAYHLVVTGTIDGQWMSPSGVAISGSMRLLPGAGFALAGAFPNGPVLFGSQQSAIYFNSQGTGNIGGFAAGWLG